MRVVDSFLDALPPLALVVGKGGVGKTTCAAGLLGVCADRGERTLLVSADPAASLGTVLGIPLLPGEQREIDELPGCAALQLDAETTRAAFLARWRDTIVTIMDRGTYLDVEDIGGLVDASFPGADEIFAMLSLAELAASGARSWDRMIVDTAPTGHALRLLSLPETFDAMVSLLDAMQAKHRFMVSALTHRYQSDAADDFLSTMRGLVAGLRSALGDPKRAAAVLVSRAERVVVDETRRYAAALQRLHIATAAVVVQALPEKPSAEERRAIAGLTEIGAAMFALAKEEPPPMGVAAVRNLGARLREIPRNAAVRKETKRLRQTHSSGVTLFSGGDPRAATSLLRSLTIVGGKGGVGKTTVATALALTAALDSEGTSRALLVSTDPAPSIGDALGISDIQWARRAPQTSPDAPRLDVWQMDASTAFEDLRDRYRERIDELFDGWIGRGVDVAHDRAILRELLALAPPGIDELYALSGLGEVLADQRYDWLIVDPAPTGHLLRLIQMPAVALDWSHRLMRLILKYRDIAGLGDASQELVSFSRRTRALDQLLHDGSRAGLVLVSLEEPVVVAESARLSTAIHGAGIALHGMVVNRASRPLAEPPDVCASAPLVLAPNSAVPLIGTPVIIDWCQRWQRRD